MRFAIYNQLNVMDEALARKAQEAFVNAAPVGWPPPWTEIQDTELLLGVDLSEQMHGYRLTDDERHAIAFALNEVMPSADPLGIWTVVIRCQGKVIDSVLANDV